MDDQLIRELITGQKEQTELLRKYLWRFRFSLLSLLLLTTATAVGLGILVYENRTKPAPVTATITTGGSYPISTSSGTWSAPSSQGTLILSSPLQTSVFTTGPPDTSTMGQALIND